MLKIHMTNLALRMDIVFSSISFSSLTRNKKPLDPADIGPGGIYHEKQAGWLHQKHKTNYSIWVYHIYSVLSMKHTVDIWTIYCILLEFHQKKDEATLEG